MSMLGTAALATAPAFGGLMMGGGGGATTATGERPPIRQGDGQRRGDRCRGNDHRREDVVDYANHGAGSDEASLDDGRRKRIRRMG